MSQRLTEEQRLMIEAVAAQLYDRDETTIKHMIFWPMVHDQVRRHYLNVARRKLKCGEIEGWWKTLRSADGQQLFHTRERYVYAQMQAAE